MEDAKKVIHEISWGSIFKILLVLAILWLAWILRDIIVLLLVVGIIVLILEPFVAKLAEEGIPRALSVIVLYLAVLAVMGLFVYYIVPPVATQIKELTLNLPYYTSRISHIDFGSASSTVSNFLDQIASKLSGVAGGLINAIISIFGGIVSAITVFVLTYYFLVEEESIKKGVVKLIPAENRPKLLETIDKVSIKLGHWLRGVLSLMILVGIVDGTALWILGVPFALTLGIISGLLEIIPVVGPIVAALAAVFVAFISGIALWKIIVILAIYILVQQVEGHILVPKIMQKAVGLSPVVVIIAILVGNKLLGLGGAILAIPIAAGVQVLLYEYTALGK
jgi:predicted PurR-regulated permease PerM